MDPQRVWPERGSRGAPLGIACPRWVPRHGTALVVRPAILVCSQDQQESLFTLGKQKTGATTVRRVCPLWSFVDLR